MLNTYVITIDVDWASDEIIDFVAQKLVSKSIKSTWFVTHESDAIRKLEKFSHLVEIGLHPNFMSGSTQGDTPESVMSHLKKMFPEAESMRTHGLFQSSGLLKFCRDSYQIKYDSSIFLPYAPGIMPHSIVYPGSEELIRMPYFWADYTEVNTPAKSFNFSEQKYSVPGMKIFNFHPVHIALNSETPERYNRFKSIYKISKARISEVEENKNNRTNGAESVFDALIERLGNAGNSITLKEAALKWKAGNKQ